MKNACCSRPNSRLIQTSVHIGVLTIAFGVFVTGAPRRHENVSRVTNVNMNTVAPKASNVFNLKLPDWCDTKPCMNLGKCTATPDMFICVCATGFYGNRCEFGEWFGLLIKIGQIIVVVRFSCHQWRIQGGPEGATSYRPYMESKYVLG